jgi:hypothetical protein
VDKWLRTGETGVYPIGDLVGPPWLAERAMHEGVICVERIAGIDEVHPLDQPAGSSGAVSHSVASIAFADAGKQLDLRDAARGQSRAREPSPGPRRCSSACCR